MRLGELNRRDLLLQSGDLRLVRVELGLCLDDGRLRLIGALLLPTEDPVPFGQRLPLPRLLVDTQLRRILRHLELHRLRCRLARCEEQHLSRTLLGGGAAFGERIELRLLRLGRCHLLCQLRLAVLELFFEARLGRI